MSSLAQIKTDFIRGWGEMGTYWGINRTMAQIHALLMVSTRPLSTDDVMRELKISRGNANMNLRDLISWGLIRRHIEIGDRKEYFVGVTDVWEMFCTIVRERKKREVEPVIQALDACVRECEKARASNEDAEIFRKRLRALLEFVKLADTVMEKVSRQADSKAFQLLVKGLG